MYYPLRIRKEEKMKVSITQAVDKLGELLEKKKELEKVEKKIKEQLKELYLKAKLPNKVEGNNYIVSITESGTPVFYPETVKKINQRLGKDFYEVVKVEVTKLKKFMSEKEVDTLIDDYKTSVRISAKKKGGK